jgi:uncharacterized membrane protein
MAEQNVNSRLEAFCDGVFAIALTLLIIDIKIAAPESIGTTSEFWRALQHLMPTIVAFLLSFVVILITWVNHHATLKMVEKSTTSFIYANGLLLLTVVFIPFPTSLLGEYVLTDHAAPAVLLYNAAICAQSVAWILLSRSALNNGLVKSGRATAVMKENVRNGYISFVLYGLMAVAALWFPLAMATLTMLSWIFWLTLSIRRRTD